MYQVNSLIRGPYAALCNRSIIGAAGAGVNVRTLPVMVHFAVCRPSQLVGSGLHHGHQLCAAVGAGQRRGVTQAAAHQRGAVHAAVPTLTAPAGGGRLADGGAAQPCGGGAGATAA